LNINVDTIEALISHQSIKYLYTVTPTNAPQLHCNSILVTLPFYNDTSLRSLDVDAEADYFMELGNDQTGTTYSGEKDDAVVHETLGTFINRQCNTSDQTCSDDSCYKPLMNHLQYILHADNRVIITIRKQETRMKDTATYIWSMCPTCNLSTPITAVDDKILQMSFGKYIELLLYSTHFNPNLCPHEISQMFRKAGHTLEISVQKIELFDLNIPRVQINPLISLTSKPELEYPSASMIKNDVFNFYKSVEEYLGSIRLWLHFSKVNEDIRNMFSDIITNLPQEEMLIFNLVSKTSVYKLNNVRIRIRDRMLETIEQLETWYN
jgi:hypothetical protein